MAVDVKKKSQKPPPLVLRDWRKANERGATEEGKVEGDKCANPRKMKIC